MEAKTAKLLIFRAGKLGFVQVDSTFVDDQIALTGAHSIVGCAVIVHAQPDDLLSQPAGNAGARRDPRVVETFQVPPLILFTFCRELVKLG